MSSLNPVRTVFTAMSSIFCAIRILMRATTSPHSAAPSFRTYSVVWLAVRSARTRRSFFADFQGTKQIRGATQNFQVPTEAYRNGDFLNGGDSPINSTVQGAGWAQVLSKRLGYTVASGEPDHTAGCTTATCVFPNAVIPRSAWSPAAAGLLQYVPQSNTANSYFETSAASAHLTDYKGSIRGDLNTRLGKSLWLLLRRQFHAERSVWQRCECTWFYLG